MKYTIGTGYYNTHKPKEDWSWDANERTSKPDLFLMWYVNTIKYSSPSQIVVIDSSMNASKPSKSVKEAVCWIETMANLGHVIDLDKAEGITKFGGWSMSFIISAMIAYNNKTDFIYKEQDCFAFNNWTDVFYSNHGKDMLVGRETVPDARLEQSLFWIKWRFIPEFIAQYMSIPKFDGAPLFNHTRPEHKFDSIRLQSTNIGFFDMGYGRQEIELLPPVTVPFYMQQLTDRKLSLLKTANYI